MGESSLAKDTGTGSKMNPFAYSAAIFSRKRVRLGLGCVGDSLSMAEQKGGTVTSQRVPCSDSVAIGQFSKCLPERRSESTYEWLLFALTVGQISNREANLC